MAKAKKPNLSQLIRQERTVEVRAMRMKRYRNYNRAAEQAEAPIQGEIGDPVTDLLFNIYEEIRDIASFLKGDRKKDDQKTGVKKVFSEVFSGIKAKAANITRSVLGVFKHKKPDDLDTARADAKKQKREEQVQAVRSIREERDAKQRESFAKQRESLQQRKEPPKQAIGGQQVAAQKEAEEPSILQKILAIGAGILAFMQGDNIASLVGDIFNGIFKALGMENFGQFLSDVFDNIANGIRVTRDFISDAWGHLNDYFDLFMRSVKAVKKWGTDLWAWVNDSWLAKGIKAVSEGVWGGIKTAAKWVGEKTGLVKEEKKEPEIRPYMREIPQPLEIKAAEPVSKPPTTRKEEPAKPKPAPPAAAPTTIPEVKAPVTPRAEGKKDLIALFREEFNRVGITDPQAQANLLAQIQAESGFKPRSEEVGKYSAKWLFNTYPKTGKRPWGFESIEEAEEVKSKGAEAVANRIYGGRMGNKADEGYKYLGRGFIQLTGKDNYAMYGKMIGTDLVGNPDQANDLQTAIKIAVAYYTHKMKKGVDLRNINEVTKAVGPANLAEQTKVREKYAKAFMEETSSSTMLAQAPDTGANLDRQSQSVQGKKKRPVNVNLTVMKVDNSQTVTG